VRGAARLLATLAAGASALAAPPAGASAQDRGEPEIDAEAAILVDAKSGTVIAAEGARTRLPIASATKLMTALVTLEETRPSTVFTAAGYEPAPIESQIGLRDGERMAVRDLLVALLLESANDAAVTLADGVAGGNPRFVAAMNARAEGLGLEDTSYENPIGFDDPRNYSTASDLALLARHLMEIGRFRDIVEEPRLELRSGDVPRVVENRNELVGEASLVDGVKTGHTLGAGYVLVGSAADDGNRVVSVVLGAASEQARDRESLELLRYGLGEFRERRPIRAGEPLADAAVAHRDDDRVDLAAANGVSVTALRGEAVETRIEAPAELEGPLPAGEEVGSAAVTRGDEVAARVPLVTVAEVPAPGFPTRVASTLGSRPAAVAAIAAALCVALVLAVVLVRRASERTRPESGSHT
jgi:serine-type D-Ala-D-Ala carboxypeptidase (penicillin-binding protein 5/6)